MNRFQLIEKLIKENNYTSYVEVGVYRGRLFLPLRCKKKIAVDPVMKINWRGRLVWVIKNIYNLNNRYFELTSDEFFKEKAPILFKEKGVDLFFIDGLHTFEASLKDVLNSLKYLDKNGIIVMHDCVPPHQAAATAAPSFHEAERMEIEGWTGQWCGDVWKTIQYLKIKYPEKLEITVLKEDFGLGIIKTKESFLDVKIDSQLFKKLKDLPYNV
ncbi:class I SAM-dependent methyltransferase [Salinimicrobium flavum]|uniref:Class I SAM-dependent methyltransferase n=1 Tax=Salinimicrobium flavum TaxID=1737065 RepID=A0ABW5IWC6_9FLAO